MTKNTTFMEEFAVNVREYLTELEQRIGMFSKSSNVLFQIDVPIQ